MNQLELIPRDYRQGIAYALIGKILNPVANWQGLPIDPYREQAVENLNGRR